MDADKIIDISSDEDERGSRIDRREILEPAIQDVVAALGGYEGGVYKLGDQAYGCLKDLKKLWRKDDTDDERTAARIFFETRVLPKDLVPILLETAGKGNVEDKCAIACADLMTAMTWPIDIAEELKELDADMDEGTDYTQLIESHLHYKAALLRSGVAQALFGIMLPCITREKKDRKDRDGQIVNVVLHLIRNLAFIRDRPANMYASSDQAEFSTMQSRLILALSESHTIDLLITLASNCADPFLNSWNTLVLEIFYLLFRGTAPSKLAVEQEKRQKTALLGLLQAEDKVTRENRRKASSRHSRFGTTISVQVNKPSKAPEGDANANNAQARPATSTVAVLHKQQALNKDTGSLLDQKKRKIKGKVVVSDFVREDNLSAEVLVKLQETANTFIESCFNPFLASILKDIKSERPKITEKDHLRLLFVTKWFLEFFLLTRSKDTEKNKGLEADAAKRPVWDFAFVGEVVERSWIIWVLKRMRGAVEEKPKLWTELQAGIECLTQLLHLIDAMTTVQIQDENLLESAELLQQQLIYNGEVLDIAVDSLKSYKDGVQSLRYLDSSVNLAYSLLRMLERWAKRMDKGEMYVRKKTRKRRKGKDGAGEGVEGEEEAPPPESDKEDAVQESLFSFEAFEAKFAQEDITTTLMTYLSRYREFTSSDQMKRVVNLLHRQAVKAKAEGLFFKVSILNLFKSMADSQKSFPREQPYKDLMALVNYLLRKFFKAVEQDPIVIVEAFYPKNRGRWKAFSSWEQPEKPARSRKQADSDDDDDNDHDEEGPRRQVPAEVHVKKGYKWSEQVAIVVAALVDEGKDKLIEWVKETLKAVIEERNRIIEETDGVVPEAPLGLDAEEDEAEGLRKVDKPSDEALAKLENFTISYPSSEYGEASTKNTRLKLLFKLLNFVVQDENAKELQWYVPAVLLPTELQRCYNVISHYLENPLDLEGKKADQLLAKTRQRRTRRRKAVSDNEQGAHVSGSDDDLPAKKRKSKRKKEEIAYKSAQFIEDSDAEMGDDADFFKKEEALRARTHQLAAEGKSATMRSTGTKKRRKKAGDDGKPTRKKRRPTTGKPETGPEEDAQQSSSSDSEGGQSATFEKAGRASSSTPGTSPPPEDELPQRSLKKAPKPRPRFKKASPVSTEESQASAIEKPPTSTADRSDDRSLEADGDVDSDLEVDTSMTTHKLKGKRRAVVSDDEDDG